MADRPERRYFDSDVITRFLENRPEREIIESLVDEAASEQWTLTVSAITLLEVTRERNKPVDPSKHARIESFFENEYILIRNLDVPLAERAQRLIYDYLWLYPMDAAHLATAIDTGCQIFYTYDRQLIDKFDNERGLRVIEPRFSDVD
jgi:predicted nucleic acid-binding protein